MKQFLLLNWYKLMIGSSLLMGSFGLMIYSVNSAYAGQSNKPYQSIPVNQDGTISIKLTDEQLKLIAPASVQQVDIIKIAGGDVGYGTKGELSSEVRLLGTCSTSEVHN